MKFGIMTAVFLFLSIAGANTATTVCENIHGKNANVDILDSCKTSFAEFTTQQEYLKVAEMAKAQLKLNPKAVQKMMAVGSAMIQTAGDNYVLVTQGAVSPQLGLNYGVGGGVSCTAALDYAQDDEFPPVIPGLFDCQANTGVWINYTNNTCNYDNDTLKYEQSEMMIDFQIKEDGTIVDSSIMTRPLVVIHSCAG
jgi:hypothetical protein